jgi:hypothetical protein
VTWASSGVEDVPSAAADVDEPDAAYEAAKLRSKTLCGLGSAAEVVTMLEQDLQSFDHVNRVIAFHRLAKVRKQELQSWRVPPGTLFSFCIHPTADLFCNLMSPFSSTPSQCLKTKGAAFASTPP